MRLAGRLVGGKRRAASGKHGHAHDRECNQPLEQQHCRLLSSTKNGLANQGSFLPPTAGMMFGRNPL
jgi:hypothetical protein